MKDSELLALCNKFLSYNPDTGIFTNRIGRQGAAKGQVAGSANDRGYWQIMISRKSYLAHRLAFLMTYNYLPEFIDHKNQVTSDNWIDNLRECTLSQNMMNRRIQKNNTSGYKGVIWEKSRSKWMAKIEINNKSINLGRFDDKIDAAKAYNKAVKKHFPEFGYLNEIKDADKIINELNSTLTIPTRW